MKNRTVKLLKFLSGTLILLCSVLSVMVTPGYEDFKSILNINTLYNNIPYKDNVIDEIAMATDTMDKTVLDTFIGTITAYGPDCRGCIGITASGYKVAEKVDGVFKTITITYDDKEYGTLRILAAANSKFPIGTIVRISGSNIEGYITGIVLDTGSAMRNEWSKGNVLMDLLFETEFNDECPMFGRKRDVKFEILRYGF